MIFTRKEVKSFALKLLLMAIVIFPLFFINRLIKKYTEWDSDYALGLLVGMIISSIKIRK